MGDFRRTRSKVWWSDYFRDDTDDAEDTGGGSGGTSTPTRAVVSRHNWRRSLILENGVRNSSSSPSNGSQKSQDSGFSDSESSSPSTCSLKSSSSEPTKKGGDENKFPTAEETRREYENSGRVEGDRSTTDSTVTSRLHDIPATNRIPRPYLLRHKKRDPKNVEKVEQNLELIKSKCNSISNYLADCYFPISDFANGGGGGAADNRASSETTPPASIELPSSNSRRSSYGDDQKYPQTVSLNTSKSSQDYRRDCESSSFSDIESRTCFIVDELPKKHITSANDDDTGRAQCKPRKSSSTLRGSLETLSSTGADDDCKTPAGSSGEETAKYIAENDRAKDDSDREKKKSSELPRIDADLFKEPAAACEESRHRLSNLDLSHLSEPAHTSTPKKDETKIRRRLAKKHKRTTKIDDNNIRRPDSPMTRWSHELRHRYEPECTTVLQAKSVTQCYRRRDSSTVTISESSNSVQSFQHKTKIIANEFFKLYEKFNLCAFDRVKSYLQSLINHIMEFIISYSQLLPRMEYTGKENLLKLMDTCDRLRQIICPYVVDTSSLLNDIHILEKLFSQFVDCVLTQQIILFTAVLENRINESDLLNALVGITSLASNTPQTIELITQLSAIQSLLTTCRQSSSVIVRKAALRALTVVCQNAKSIKRLETEGGIEVLSELLSDSTKSENELLEVMSVLVQITAPWVEDDHVIKGLIYHLYPIIKALTGLITTTNSSETLLLSAAALANISFIEPQAVYILSKLDTTDRLLTAVRKLGAKSSIFLQEQVATLVANMAAVPETRSHLAQHRAVGALLYFLQVQHSPIQTVAEIAAAERLQHKSAIALSRLCTNPEISKQVIELQGVPRLVRLCREERERNYSDGVLVACLASLRKITANCGNDSINQLNAKELVEPRLVDSFLLYSSRQESYV